MSDQEYTPTTEEIRQGYIGQPEDHFMDPLIGAEFDRWLNEQLAEAWDAGWRVGWGRPPIAPIQGNPYRMEES